MTKKEVINKKVMGTHLAELVREKMHQHKLKSIQISSELGIPASSFSLFLNQWQDLPEKHMDKLISFFEDLESQQLQGGK